MHLMEQILQDVFYYSFHVFAIYIYCRMDSIIPNMFLPFTYITTHYFIIETLQKRNFSKIKIFKKLYNFKTKLF